MATRHLGLKIELDPTTAQQALLASYAGTRRFVYNWALETANARYWDEIRPAQEKIRAENAARGAEIKGLEEARLPVSEELRHRRALTQPVHRYTAVDLINRWNREKRTIAPWIDEVAACVATQAIIDAVHTIGKYLDGLSGQGPRIGRPRFRAKGRSKDAFRVPGDTATYKREAETRDILSTRINHFPITPKTIGLPRIGKIQTKQDATERLRPGDWISSVTVSRDTDRWYAALKIRREVPAVIEYVPDRGKVIGIDLGIKTFAVCSDGSTIASPQPLKASLADLRRQQRTCARKRNVVAGVKTARTKKREAHRAARADVRYWPTEEERLTARSARRQEQDAIKEQKKAELATLQAAARSSGLPVPTKLPKPEREPEHKSNRLVAAEETVARTHRRVANRRDNFLHETTTHLVRRAAKCGAALSLANLVKNHHLARSISDQGWSEFRRQITYKAEWAGVPLFIAPSNLASSKTCSRCGERRESLTLADRIFRCDRCGLTIDRDLNAARNLRKAAMMAIARGEFTRPMTSSGQDSVKRRLTPQRAQPLAAGL
jgi:IS605 OrfB family transposase